MLINGRIMLELINGHARRQPASKPAHRLEASISSCTTWFAGMREEFAATVRPMVRFPVLWPQEAAGGKNLPLYTDRRQAQCPASSGQTLP